MPTEQESFLAFLQEQKVRQTAFFPTVKHDKVVSFMGTVARPGAQGQVSVHRVLGLAAGPTPRELRVTLAGPLPRPPGPGELLTVHLTRAEHYQGYQVKTRPLLGAARPEDLVEVQGDRLLVKGESLFTVHHSPYVLKFFETVPLEEVLSMVGPVGHAIVCVGESANLSPRFVFHQELREGRLALYHGDGLALKTYMNLRPNPRGTSLVLDLETYRGFALRGPVQEFSAAEHPEAHERICRGFAAGGWGKPARTFRLAVEELFRLEPSG